MRTPIRPADYAENYIIDGILEGKFPIDSDLPAERQLASQLGVTRPTLREALQRMQRDGWIEIRQGKPTRVRNYWQEGNLGVLATIAHRSENLPPAFIHNLLEVRILLAPEYTRLSVKHHPTEVLAYLNGHHNLADTPQSYAYYDWGLHHKLTILSGNPIFTLILNGFKDLYVPMACIYFSSPDARFNSKEFYSTLEEAVTRKDSDLAGQITKSIMRQSVILWQNAIEKNGNKLDNFQCSEED